MPPLSWPVFAGLLGGVGLFLLGMRLMTDGLRLSAGRALRDILTRSTATPGRGLLSGILITTVVQSSSAVTVATIGFVNAGLLSLGQALAVVYGSNVGTTATGWLVAAVGLHVDVKALALPLLGVGMALGVARRSGRAGHLGEALAGFGAFFLGIDVLRGAFESWGGGIPVGAPASGPLGVVLLVGVGFVLTVLLQSSSAAIALILTSVGGGALAVESGAALVIGANLGTTTTAVLATLGATPNARRVAAGHVAFNLLTGVVALLLLPFLLMGLAELRRRAGLGSEPAAIVAAFHTVFNVLGVLLMIPLSPRLARFLEGRFRTAAEEEARLRYLDANVAQTPDLAVGALGLELGRIAHLTRHMGADALFARPPQEAIDARRDAVTALVEGVGDFLDQLRQQRLSASVQEALPLALRAARSFAETAELAQAIAHKASGLDPLPAGLEPLRAAWQETVMRLFAAAAVGGPDASPEAAAALRTEVDDGYTALKQTLVDAAARGRLPVASLVARVDHLSDVHQLARQVEHGARHLWALQALSEGRASEVDVSAP